MKQTEIDCPPPAKPVSLTGPCHLCGRGTDGPMFALVTEEWFLVLRTEGGLVTRSPVGPDDEQTSLPGIVAGKRAKAKAPAVDKAGGHYDAHGVYVPPPADWRPAVRAYFPRPLCYDCTRRAVLWLNAQGVETSPEYAWCFGQLNTAT